MVSVKKILNFTFNLNNERIISILLSEARKAARQQHWQIAAEKYRKILDYVPDNKKLWVQYGHALKEEGNFANAEDAYERALILDPNDVDVRLHLGKLLRQQGENTRSWQIFLKAYEISPNDQSIRLEIFGPEFEDVDHLSDDMIENAPWFSKFIVPEFRALYSGKHFGDTKVQVVIKEFIKNGIDDLSPISFSYVFDPSFYKKTQEGLEIFSDSDAYRHWLGTGISKNIPSSASQLLFKHCGIYEVPYNFDYNKYKSEYIEDKNITKEDVFIHLVEYGFENGYHIPITEGNPSLIYRIIADFYFGKSYKLAIMALAQAAIYTPESPVFFEHIGDAYLAEQMDEKVKFRNALMNFKKAANLNSIRVETYIHLLNLLTINEDFDSAIYYIEKTKNRFIGNMAWMDAIKHFINKYYDFYSIESFKLMKDGKYKDGDQCLQYCLNNIQHFIATYEKLPVPVVGTDGPVIMLSLVSVPQCKHYRVEQRCEQFEEAGIPYKLFADGEQERAQEALPGARALLIYRVAASVSLVRLVLHARAMGIPVFYEIDDLIFDRQYYPAKFEDFQGHIDFNTYTSLHHGVTLYRYAMAMCDTAIASTTALSEHMAAVVQKKECFLISNALDSRNDRFLDILPLGKNSEEFIYIFYGSGSIDHNRNFNQCIAPSLARILRNEPNVRLVIVGNLSLSNELETYQGKIIKIPFIEDTEKYWSLLSKMSINIATLVPGEMNDCKSEIKWLEAAVSGVPSVVSASRNYKDVLDNGIDAFLIYNNSEWETSLLKLIRDADLRNKMGENAKKKAIENYSLSIMSKKVSEIFKNNAGNFTLKTKKKNRLLISAVLFPPQLFGGATRVVKDNVDYFIDRYSNDFDIAIFTCDVGGQPHVRRVCDYRGIPVFRWGPSHGTHEYLYNDLDAKEAFEEVVSIWRPDVVHFHCIQFLTASICDVCYSHHIPYIITVHDGWWLSHNQFLLDDDMFLRIPTGNHLDISVSPERMLSDLDRATFLRLRMDRAVKVLSVSESFAKIYQSCGVRNIMSVPNGVSDAFLDSISSVENRASTGKVTVAHIGGLLLHKGIHLLKACLMNSTYKNLEFIVMDHNKESGYVSETTWGKNKIKIIGKINQDDMIGFYKSINILLAPSIWPESYGLVSREALACGNWVVASNIGAISEDIVAGENGFIIDINGTSDMKKTLDHIDKNKDIFLRPPSCKIEIRRASQQADDLIDIYHDIIKINGLASVRRLSEVSEQDVRTC